MVLDLVAAVVELSGAVASVVSLDMIDAPVFIVVVVLSVDLLPPPLVEEEVSVVLGQAAAEVVAVCVAVVSVVSRVMIVALVLTVEERH